MKKILALTMAVLFCLLGVAVSAKSEFTDASITAAYGTPVIDGDLDDIWNTTEVQDVKLVDTEVIPSTTGVTGTVRVMWDEKYLYVFVQVDKHGEVICSGGGSENTDDCADVCYTLNGDFTGENNVVSGSAYAGVFRVLEDGSFGGFGDHTTNFNSDFQGKMKRTSDSTYNSEYAVPWEDIKASAGYVMSMDIQINVATDGARIGLVNWAYQPCYGWRDSKYHGMVTLLAAVIETEAETTAAPVAAETAAAAPAETAAVAAAQTSDNALAALAALLCLAGAGYAVCRKRHS